MTDSKKPQTKGGLTRRSVLGLGGIGAGAIALGVGNYYANKYAPVINTYLGQKSYEVKDGGAGDGERTGVCCVADLHVLRLDGDGFALRDGVSLVLVLARAGVDQHAAHFFVFPGRAGLNFLR